MTSASSKTAMGLASVARDRRPMLSRIGLTSAGNVDFVDGPVCMTRCWLTMHWRTAAGAERVGRFCRKCGFCLRQSTNAWATQLKYSCLVGATHIDARGGGAKDMPGPEPILFFAPDHAVAAVKADGAQASARPSPKAGIVS